MELFTTTVPLQNVFAINVMDVVFRFTLVRLVRAKIVILNAHLIPENVQNVAMAITIIRLN
ncbi:8604_t:CDS:1, partial [Racocetra persica]